MDDNTYPHGYAVSRRRGRDSNPQGLSGRLFSRQVPCHSEHPSSLCGQFIAKPTIFQIMLFSVTVWTHKLQINEVVMCTVSIPVMYLQYLYFGIGATLTFYASLLKQSQLKSSLCLYLVSGTILFVVYARTMFVRAAPTARFLVRAGKNRLSTNNARLFSAVGLPATGSTTEHSSAPYFRWASINRHATRHAYGIRSPFVMIGHSGSIPLLHPANGAGVCLLRR